MSTDTPTLAEPEDMEAQATVNVSDLTFAAAIVRYASTNTRIGDDVVAELATRLEAAAHAARLRLPSVTPEGEVATVARPRSEWYEDYGDVLWWRLPVVEPPYVGSPLEEDFDQDWFTHWTPIVYPASENKVPR